MVKSRRGYHLMREFPKVLLLVQYLFLSTSTTLQRTYHNMRLFADDSSLFIKVRDVAETQSQLMDDLDKITNWAHQWKMEFNPGITKQAIEVIFSHKKNKPAHHPLFSMVSRSRESRIPSIWALFSINVSISVYIFRKKLRRPTKALAC